MRLFSSFSNNIESKKEALDLQISAEIEENQNNSLFRRSVTTEKKSWKKPLGPRKKKVAAAKIVKTQQQLSGGEHAEEQSIAKKTKDTKVNLCWRKLEKLPGGAPRRHSPLSQTRGRRERDLRALHGLLFHYLRFRDCFAISWLLTVYGDEASLLLARVGIFFWLRQNSPRCSRSGSWSSRSRAGKTGQCGVRPRGGNILVDLFGIWTFSQFFRWVYPNPNLKSESCQYPNFAF